METLQRTANRGSISTGYDVDNSLKFESDNSEYVERTQGTPDSRKTGSVSFWIKRTEISTSSVQFAFEAGNTDNDNGRIFLRFQTDDTLRIAGGSTVFRQTSQVFRDTSAWYHILFVMDTTQSTADDRIKLYVNGSQVTDFGTKNNFSQNDLTGINYQKLSWGRSHVDSGSYSNMYLAEAVTLDGVAASPTDFGEFDSDSGIWIPKDLSNLTFGSEGTYLDFSSSSDLGNDVSGNNNDFGTLGNIAAADQATDTPTNNFCTMNINFKTNDNIVVSEGQTKVTCGSGTGWLSNVGTFALTKGKWYWELASVTSVYQIFGIADASDSIIPQAAGGYYVGYGSNDTTLSVGMYMVNGSIYGNQDGGSGVGISPSAVGDVYGVALDLDNLGFYIIRNGVSPSGSDPSSGSSLTGAVTWNDSIYSGFYYPAVSVFQGNGLEMNFGGYTSNPIASAASDANGYGNFEYAPPSGYYAICTKNLAEYG
jgi:hypothetical protein